MKQLKIVDALDDDVLVTEETQINSLNEIDNEKYITSDQACISSCCGMLFNKKNIDRAISVENIQYYCSFCKQQIHNINKYCMFGQDYLELKKEEHTFS